jgi:hypothetical protein
MASLEGDNLVIIYYLNTSENLKSGLISDGLWWEGPYKMDGFSWLQGGNLVIIYYLNAYENLKSGLMIVMAFDERGLIRWMASLDLRGQFSNILLSKYIWKSEIWPYESDGLWWEGPYKMDGLSWLEGGNLVIIYYLNTSENLKAGLIRMITFWWEGPYNKRGGLWWNGPYKWDGLWWECPYKKGGLWWECLIRRVAFGEMCCKKRRPDRRNGLWWEGPLVGGAL